MFRRVVKLKLHSDIYIHNGLEQHGDLIDLRCCELGEVFYGNVEPVYDLETGVKYIKYKKGAIFKIKLGVAMKLPKRRMAEVYPRSGTRKNFGVMLTNSVGEIDNNFNGTNDEWQVEFYAIEDGMMALGDRVVQFKITKTMPKYKFKRVDKLERTDRGGFGSSGK